MARKLRLEYPGACYHVINRGNYRGAVFKTKGARLAFEVCLLEACGRSGCRTSLDEAGCLSDTRAGWQSYAAYLDWQASAGPVGRTKAYVCMSEGWALGSAGFKQAIRRDHVVATEARAWDEAGVRETRQAEWTEVLQRLLKAAGKTAEDVRLERRAAAWQAGIAQQMKQSTRAGNRWLAEHLNLGSPKAASVYVGRLRTNEALLRIGHVEA
jgi:hypothetical protein